MKNSSGHEEKLISLNQNLSFIESQPTVHFPIINEFLTHTETIYLFRSSSRLYLIPLLTPIFLHYFSERNLWKKSLEYIDVFNPNRFSFTNSMNFSFRFFLTAFSISS